MAIKKSELYSSLWESCNELRGGMDASQYKDYVLTMLFVKYVSDKYANKPFSLIEVPKGATFEDMVALKGQPDIGDRINKEILRPLFAANGLEGAMELVDFNDDDKLGSGKEKVDRLSRLIAIFENPGLNFKNNRADDDDILGDAYEFLMRHFATESGKSKGQFYTPAEVSRILAKVIDVHKADKPSYSAYDPTCGSGSLLLKVAEESPNGLTLYGQEKDIATKGLAIMNMWLHGYPEATIAGRNTLAFPQFQEEDGLLKRFDFVVANPPFSLKNWSSGLTPSSDHYRRFQGFGIPPEKNGDYAFLLHIIASLKSTGKGAVILPHGVLFRGNAEADIRENLIKRRWIKGIIGLPANLFYGTGIPACIIVIDKENADSREGIFMIDASEGYMKDGNKNRLREQDIHKIVDSFNRQWEINKYSRLVPFEEIEGNEYNLNIPRYIDTQEEEDKQDLNAHLNGGIPTRDIDGLQEYWKVYPSIREEVFEPLREGYSWLCVNKDEVKDIIYGNPEFKAYQEKLDEIFEEFKRHNYPAMVGVHNETSPKPFIYEIAEDILERYANRPLITRYDIYQHLMNYWKETMKDDTYLIIEDGWVAKVERVLEKKKSGKTVDKGWTCELVPKELVISKYLASDQKKLENLNAELEATEAERSSMEEEHGEEDGALYEVSKIGDAKNNLQEFKILAAEQYDPVLYHKIRKAETRLEELEGAQREMEQEALFQSLQNSRGNITQSALKEKMDEAEEVSEAYRRLKAWFDLSDDIKEQKKELSSVYKKLDKLIESRIAQDGEAEFIKEVVLIQQYLDLYEQNRELKKAIKGKEAELDEETLQKFMQLDANEVKELVVEDKWLASIKARINTEIDDISQRLTGRVTELAERYGNTLSGLNAAVKEIEEKVEGHLEKMGLVWK